MVAALNPPPLLRPPAHGGLSFIRLTAGTTTQKETV